ncbi:MAG: GntR family transcriptional regulator [Kiloniellales bacterium]
MVANNGLGEVVGHLEEDIVFGRRRPRERLIEEDLVAEFGAKKHVVRQALAELERMGLVERKRNKGACVRDYSPEDVQQIFAVRELLEAEAARQIPLPAPKALIDSLTAIYREHSEAVDSNDLARAFRVNIRFHQTLFGACGNPYLVEAINTFAFKSHAVRSYSLAKPDLLRNARKEHAAMIDALKKGGRERLVDLCIAHLKPPVKAYIDAYEQIFGPALRRSA